MWNSYLADWMMLVHCYISHIPNVCYCQFSQTEISRCKQRKHHTVTALQTRATYQYWSDEQHFSVVL